MEIVEHEVRFDIWCKYCKYKDTDEYEDPCDECLEYSAEQYSTRPNSWKPEDSDSKDKALAEMSKMKGVK